MSTHSWLPLPNLLRLACRLLLLATVILLCGVASPALAESPLAMAASSLGLTTSPFEVVIEGVDGVILENVTAALALPNGLVRDGRVEPIWARRFARQAKSKVLLALEPFGYYAPEVTTELTTPAEVSYRMKVSIVLGEPVRVAHCTIQLTGEGAGHANLTRQVASFPLAPGVPMRHDLYDQAKGKMLATAIDLGYLDAHFTRHEVRLSTETLLAEIELELETGLKYRFGEVTFSGAENFPQPVLHRYLSFVPGEAFSESRLAQTQANLMDADKFKRVKVTAVRSRAEGQKVPVEIELEPQPTYQIRPGLGYGTDTGPRANLRFRNSNAFHLGHEFQTDLLYAERVQSLTSRYLIPVGEHLDSVLALAVQYHRDDNDTFESSSLATEVSLTQALAKDYKATVFLNLSQETYQIGQEESRQTTLVMPGVRLAQRRWKFDSPGRPHSGHSWQLEVRGASSMLGSDVSLLQGLLSTNAILPLPWQMQLVLHGEGGTTMQDAFQDLPASLRFFAGGDQSVRGYAYKSLGPKDSQGDVIGGRHLAVGSLEIEKELVKDWSLALFYDCGNAFDDFNNFVLAHGAGVGVRRYTPIGPIKLDLARQLGNNNDYRLHLSVGFVW